MKAESRLKVLATEGESLIERRNKQTTDLLHRLKSMGLSGDWRVESHHSVIVFRPQVSIAIGDWWTSKTEPIPDGEHILGELLYDLRKLGYRLDKARSRKIGSMHESAFWTNGHDVIRVMVTYGPDDNHHVSYIEFAFYEPESAARYIGTQQWFLDKPVHNQKDYLTKKPFSKFKQVHEDHKQQKEQEATDEQDERYGRAMERLRQRLQKD
jgi:hypothetical protein